MRRRTTLAAGLGLMLALVLGCGQNPPATPGPASLAESLPAKGIVTLEGRQLDAWFLTFLPLPLGAAVFRGWVNLAMAREGLMLVFSAFHRPLASLMVSQYTAKNRAWHLLHL